MKKFSSVAVFIIVFCILPIKTHAQSSVSSLDQLSAELKTPKALETFMQNEFTFTEDRFLFQREDYWQDPQEMLELKQGDCEDYALFAKAVLERNGYRVHLISIYTDDKAHVVAVFKHNGKWYIFDRDRLFVSQGRSLRELANDVMPSWNSLGLMRKEGETGLISKKFF